MVNKKTILGYIHFILLIKESSEDSIDTMILITMMVLF